MNNFSTTQLLKCAMLMGSLIMSAVSWADDHLLSVNGATVTQLAIVPHTGTLTQPLILSNFDDNATLTLGQSQTLTVVSAPVKMCLPGTKRNLEWLDQGNTVVGVTGLLTGTSSTALYQLTLTMSGISDTYAASSGSCTVYGAKTYTYTAGAVMDKQAGAGSAVIINLTGGSKDKQTGDSKDKHTGDSKDKHTGDSKDKQTGDSKDKHTGDSKDKHTGDSEDKHTGDSEDKHTGDSDKLQSSAIGSFAIVPGISSYNFWNATHGVPEPGTMFLFLIGLLGLGWLNMTRKRQTARCVGLRRT